MPDVKKVKPVVELTGQNGNAFVIIGLAMRALRKAGYTKEELDKYRAEATSGDYSHLLQVTADWCEVE